MGVIYFYALFCITTALISTFSHFRRAILNLEFQKISTPVLDSKYVAYITYFLICLVVAPIVFIATIFPGISHRFYEGLYEALSKNES